MIRRDQIVTGGQHKVVSDERHGQGQGVGRAQPFRLLDKLNGVGPDGCGIGKVGLNLIVRRAHHQHKIAHAVLDKERHRPLDHGLAGHRGHGLGAPIRDRLKPSPLARGQHNTLHTIFSLDVQNNRPRILRIRQMTAD